MTTPAHCTRTDPHPAHETGAGRVTGARRCPGVEPPADVAATPDPRLDVVTKLVHEAECGCAVRDHPGVAHAFHARRILNALDNLAAAQTMHGPDVMKIQVIHDCPTRWWDKTEACRVYLDGWHRCNGHEPYGDHVCDCRSVAPSLLVPNGPGTPAPAELTPAQEIRLRLAEKAMSIADKSTSDDPEATEEDFVRVVSGVVLPIAAMVEHGPDETPALRVHADELRRWKAAEARADLAEARLGHIADALKDLDGRPHEVLGHREMLTLVNAIRDALAWTPDDTAETTQVGVPFRFAADGPWFTRDEHGRLTEVDDTRDPNCIERWPECVSGGYDPRCCRFPKSCSCESWTTDTAAAGADTTGDE